MEGAEAAIGGVLIVMTLIWLVLFGLWVWSLVHCIKNENFANDRTGAILLIVFLGPLGSLIYAIWAHSKSKAAVQATRRRPEVGARRSRRPVGQLNRSRRTNGRSAT